MTIENISLVLFKAIFDIRSDTRYHNKWMRSELWLELIQSQSNITLPLLVNSNTATKLNHIISRSNIVNDNLFEPNMASGIFKATFQHTVGERMNKKTVNIISYYWTIPGNIPHVRSHGRQNHVSLNSSSIITPPRRRNYINTRKRTNIQESNSNIVTPSRMSKSMKIAKHDYWHSSEAIALFLPPRT